MANNDYCCCGPCRIEVGTGAKLVAILGIVLGVVFAVLSLHDVGIFVAHLLSALLYLLVLFAHLRRNPTLNLPYLILGGLGLAALLVGCVLLFILGYHWLPILYAFALYFPLNACFYTIIWRAHKALKQQEEGESAVHTLTPL